MKIIPQLLEGLIRGNIGKEQWAQCPAWSKHSGNGKRCVLSLDGRLPNTHKHKVLRLGRAGRDWEQEEKGTTEDEMAGWHH